jgi:hypothetical protein
MDYSDDSCLSTFSKGQIRRMQSMFKYRRQKFTGVFGNGTVETDPDTGGFGPHK